MTTDDLPDTPPRREDTPDKSPVRPADPIPYTGDSRADWPNL